MDHYLISRKMSITNDFKKSQEKMITKLYHIVNSPNSNKQVKRDAQKSLNSIKGMLY